MHTFTTIVTAGALASVALAKPVPRATATKGSSFSLTGDVARTRPAPRVQLAQAYQRYGISMASLDSVAASPSGTGSVPADPAEQDTYYLCAVDIGGQTLNLDFDTGSADLWVFSTELSSSEADGHTLYNPDDSSTAQELNGYTWNITYGDGSGASGNVYTDTVTVGGIAVSGQAVELAEQVSSQFSQDTANDGLLGLAFSSINTVQPQSQTTWFQSGINDGAFAQNVFTVDLKHQEPGSYDFGYIDDSKYSGSITYTAVDNSQGFWEFTGTGYQVGSGEFTSASIDAIADTGTTLLLMDDDIVSAYYAQVQGAENDSSQGGYVFPCSASLPDFGLGIGDATSTIPGSLMSLGSVGDGSDNCFGGIQSNQGIGLSIYGDVWLKSVLAIFDADNTQLGWAPKAN